MRKYDLNSIPIEALENIFIEYNKYTTSQEKETEVFNCLVERYFKEKNFNIYATLKSARYTETSKKENIKEHCERVFKIVERDILSGKTCDSTNEKYADAEKLFFTHVCWFLMYEYKEKFVPFLQDNIEVFEKNIFHNEMNIMLGRVEEIKSENTEIKNENIFIYEVKEAVKTYKKSDLSKLKRKDFNIIFKNFNVFDEEAQTMFLKYALNKYEESICDWLPRELYCARLLNDTLTKKVNGTKIIVFDTLKSLNKSTFLNMDAISRYFKCNTIFEFRDIIKEKYFSCANATEKGFNFYFYDILTKINFPTEKCIKTFEKQVSMLIEEYRAMFLRNSIKEMGDVVIDNKLNYSFKELSSTNAFRSEIYFAKNEFYFIVEDDKVTIVEPCFNKGKNKSIIEAYYNIKNMALKFNLVRKTCKEIVVEATSQDYFDIAVFLNYFASSLIIKEEDIEIIKQIPSNNHGSYYYSFNPEISLLTDFVKLWIFNEKDKKEIARKIVKDIKLHYIFDEVFRRLSNSTAFKTNTTSNNLFYKLYEDIIDELDFSDEKQLKIAFSIRYSSPLDFYMTMNQVDKAIENNSSHRNYLLLIFKRIKETNPELYEFCKEYSSNISVYKFVQSLFV